jgi:hypothetical protein
VLQLAAIIGGGKAERSGVFSQWWGGGRESASSGVPPALAERVSPREMERLEHRRRAGSR